MPVQSRSRHRTRYPRSSCLPLQHVSALGRGPAFTLHGGTAVQTSGPVTRYASSPWAERAFCSSCGTHLFYRLLANNEHFLSAGLFQDAQGLTLAQQIYIDEKPDYYALANDTPALTGAEVQALYGDS